jgi:uncharacterized protein (TIGR03437 family)
LALDSSGHAFVTGVTWSSIANIPGSFHPQRPLPAAFVVKLNTDGTGFDYFTYLIDANIDFPATIAVSNSGEAYVAGNVSYYSFSLARLSADGSSVVYSVPIFQNQTIALAVAADGSAVVYQPGSVRHFNPQGAVDFSRDLPGSFWGSGTVSVDTAGNTYLTGFTTSANFPVKYDLGQCKSISNFLMVLDPSGNMIQSTYVPGQVPISNPNYLPFGGASALALGSGTVYLTGLAAGGNGGSLVRLSPSAQPQTVRLGCLANAAFGLSGPVAAGEIVSLFGESLSPAQPASDGTSVSVTFNGMPAPLLYTSANQVNAIVPWELKGAVTTQVCESYDGASPSCMTLDVVPAAPGVFMAESNYALALNQDGTINSASNPAPPGSIVSIFATGLGPVTPLPQDGVIAKPPVGRNLFRVVIVVATGGVGDARFIDIKPQYAGPAPFQIYGLSQVNLPAIQGYMYLHVESPRRQGPAAPKAVIGSPVPMVAPGYSQSFGIHVAPQ